MIMESTKKKNRCKRTWYERVFESTDLPNSTPKSDAHANVEKRPKWVLKVTVEILSQVMPAISIKKLREITPKNVGKFLGQKYANLYALKENPQAVKKLGNMAVDLEKNVLQAFKAALGQPSYKEAAEFFQGFAKGMSKKGLTSKGMARETTATPIYTMMLIHWREVDRLASVPKLREFLINYGLPKEVVGDISRLRRLCTRVRYAPGKRGRPPKSEK